MSFERFVCWEPSRIQQVMNTEALQPRNDVFLATHHPVRMYRGSRVQDAQVPYDQATFLDDFLAPEGFAFVPVLGNAGTGKSHLVRWLWINVPPDEKRRVILIPRGGTNLRGVVELILRDMEGPAFDRYRDRLGNATNNLSLPQARHVLLDNLALAAGPDGAGGTVSDVSADVREAHEHLRTYLPALLRDQFFRSHLLREEGIIDQLVRHALGSADRVERRDARRQFSADDLPLSVTDYQRAGADARQIFGELSTDSWLRGVTVDWLNLHLEEAIGRLLQLGGADLTNLMRDVRADLAGQGIELVLLIEDFARLQGIERQLLDALLEQPNQPDRPLCALRTALACTTDYFEKVADTVSQRTTFVVKLDREMSGGGAAISPPEFQHFAARYLNAARLPEGVLESWYDRRGDENAPPPNRCATCEFAPECHAAFGARDGMGLYPFNADALGTMYARTDAQGFSPRLLITGVLRPTLEKYGDDLAHGTFPPPALLAGLGGSRISAADRAAITSLDAAHAARREVLQEFWAGGRLMDLDPTVHRAFSLPALGLDGETPATVRIRSKADVDVEAVSQERGSPTPGLPRRLAETLLALDAWQNGVALDQDAVNHLREPVFYAVVNRLDWSTEFLTRTEFASPTGMPFRRTSINFHNQETQRGSGLVQLVLPLAGESLTVTALALQAVLLYEHHGNWHFDWGLGGARYQRVLAGQVERWATEVLGQIRATFRSEPGWDPVPAAVEILALDARMAGGLPPLRPPIDELVDAVFAPLAGDADGRAPAWAELVKTLRRHREALTTMVITRVGASKGTERARIVDAARLVPALAAITAEWRPREPIPEDLPAPHFDALSRARGAVDRLLDLALQQERERQLAAFDAVAAHLGDGGHRAAADAVRAAMTRARDGGVFSGGNPEALERAVQAFRASAFGSWAEHAARVREQAEPRHLIGLLSQDHSRAAGAAAAFVEAADRFLTASTQRAETEVEQFTAGAGRDIDASLHGIENRFAALDRALATIREENS